MATDPISEGRMGALQRMTSPGPDDGGSEIDADGDGVVSLAEISDAISEFIDAGNIPPQAASDLSKARDLIEKWSTREEAAEPEEADEEAAPPLEEGA